MGTGGVKRGEDGRRGEKRGHSKSKAQEMHKNEVSAGCLGSCKQDQAKIRMLKKRWLSVLSGIRRSGTICLGERYWSREEWSRRSQRHQQSSVGQ